MSHFHFLDWAILAAYTSGLIWIGIFRLKDQSSSQEEFILSGRRLSLGGFVVTLVTTWYGAILGLGENTFLYGIQTWFIFALPYYGFALGYAYWIAPKIREKNFLSIPDHFRFHYGDNAGIISALRKGALLIAGPRSFQRKAQPRAWRSPLAGPWMTPYRAALCVL